MNKFNKIRIVGGSGSGKSYLGKNISFLIGVPLTSLDELKYAFSNTCKFDNNNKRSDEEILKLLKKVTIKKKWIIDGVYYILTKDTYDSADVIIFLNPSFLKRFFNTVNRFFKRIFENKYEGLLNFFSLTIYNIKTRQKWRERESLIRNIYKNKFFVFKSADSAFDWFVKQKK